MLNRIILIVLLISFPFESLAKVKVILGSYVTVVYGNKIEEVYRVNNGEFIFGAGWIDEHNIYVAIEDSQSSSTNIDIISIDVSSKSRKPLLRLDNAGETSFDDHKSKYVTVFNERDGIKVMFKEKDTLKVNKISLPEEVSEPFSPIWLDDDTIGFEYFSNGIRKFQKVNVKQAISSIKSKKL